MGQQPVQQCCRRYMSKVTPWPMAGCWYMLHLFHTPLRVCRHSAGPCQGGQALHCGQEGLPQVRHLQLTPGGGINVQQVVHLQ